MEYLAEMQEKYKLAEKFPFINVIVGNNNNSEFLGIVLANTKETISFIDFDKIHSVESMSDVMKLAQDWWWYSNRMIPMNLYGEYYKLYWLDNLVTHIPSRFHTITTGHVCSLDIVLETTRKTSVHRPLKIIQLNN